MLFIASRFEEGNFGDFSSACPVLESWLNWFRLYVRLKTYRHMTATASSMHGWNFPILIASRVRIFNENERKSERESLQLSLGLESSWHCCECVRSGKLYPANGVGFCNFHKREHFCATMIVSCSKCSSGSWLSANPVLQRNNYSTTRQTSTALNCRR